MMIRIFAFASAVCGAIAAGALLPSAVEAQLDNGREPTVYARRSMTIDQKTLRIDIGPRDFALGSSGNVRTYRRYSPRGFVVHNRDVGSASDDPHFGLGVGFAFGVHDSLELGLTAIPILFTPRGRYGDVEFDLRWRFLSGVFEMGLQATARAPFYSNQFALAPGLPMAAHVGRNVRLDFGVELELEWVRPRAVDYNLDLPFAAVINVHERVFLGPRTGLFVRDLRDAGHVSVPAGFFVGFSVPTSRSRPLFDMTFSFLWPDFFNTRPGREPFYPEHWVLQFGANFFIHL